MYKKSHAYKVILLVCLLGFGSIQNIFAAPSDSTLISDNKVVYAEKNEFILKFGLPVYNRFFINKGATYGDVKGALGISINAEYYFLDNLSFDAKFGFAVDDPHAFADEPPIDEAYNSTTVSFLALQMGREWKFFHTSFGIQLNQSNYYETNPIVLADTIIRNGNTLIQNHFGAAFSAYVNTMQYVSIGVNYFPSLIGWKVVGWKEHELELHYTHLITFELIIRIKTKD